MYIINQYIFFYIFFKNNMKISCSMKSIYKKICSCKNISMKEIFVFYKLHNFYYFLLKICISVYFQIILKHISANFSLFSYYEDLNLVSDGNMKPEIFFLRNFRLSQEIFAEMSSYKLSMFKMLRMMCSVFV